MKRQIFVSFLVSICTLFTFSVEAQQVTPVTEEIKPDNSYDPIAAMLDSLVSQNFLNRYNFVNDIDLDAEAYTGNAPTFSDEVYRTRMSKINSPIPLTYNRSVKEYIELYATRKRGLTSRALGLSQLYFPLFEEVLDKHNLPLEFKYLAIVESALNPVAVSHMGATGIWQFMYNTGKMYNLQITSYVDERRDPYKSTVAACHYFQDMYKIYGDWLLVIAAYNCGPGNVNKAIRRAGGSKNFWDISPYLPAETRGYVPAFIAVCYVMNYSKEHKITPVQPSLTYFEVDTVKVDQSLSFSKISTALDIPMDLLSYLNPAYKKNFIPVADIPQPLRLPVNKIAQFISSTDALYIPDPVEIQLAAQAETDRTMVNTQVKKYVTVRKGQTLSTIASANKCTVNDLKKWNKLKSTRIGVGQKLAIYQNVKQPAPKTQVAAKTEKPADSTNKSTEKSSETRSDFIYYTIQPGDTLWNIAQRYDGVTVEELKQINKINNGKDLQPGTRIKVRVPS
ncbi:MAG: LysM peptidoglycan-binding domain-containing protein [Bacteroidia bacterium]